MQHRRYETRDEALANGSMWTYGYALDPQFHKQIQEQLPKEHTQYDLEVFFFLNYVPNAKRRHKGFPTDIPREEHLWRAIEMRWPTKVDDIGRPTGQMMRDPWSEKVFEVIAKNDTAHFMGGSGQGKTKTLMAFGIIIWDYFYHTPEGARFQFSSVSERKINDACWAYCRQLYNETVRSCSPNVGHGIIYDGQMEIRRNKKLHKGTLQAIIRGVLISNDSKAETRIDGLTGAHEPHAQILVTDEAQSSPNSLSRAGKNLRTHADWFWELLSGNPADSSDYLGQSAKPPGGWDTVDPIKVENAPLEWATNNDGKKGYTVRFDNDFSPGMEDPLKFWYRPTQAFRDREYPTAVSRKTAEYYRFWKGWFVPGFVDDVVIPWAIIEGMGCHAFPNINRAANVENFMSFDSAPESLDRSPLGHFQILYEGNKRVLNVAQIFMIPKLNPDTYDRDAARIIMDKAVEWQVPSGNLIQDYTNRSGPKSMLQEIGFHSHGMIYSDKASDRPIDPKLQHTAYELYGNIITEAAFLLEAFIRYGQVRGLNDSIIPDIKDELCMRKVSQQVQNSKTKLEAKGGPHGFRKTHGFSPDVFDIICQAAWFARERFGLIPGEVDKAPVFKHTTKVSNFRNGGYQRRY